MALPVGLTVAGTTYFGLLRDCVADADSDGSSCGGRLAWTGITSERWNCWRLRSLAWELLLLAVALQGRVALVELAAVLQASRGPVNRECRPTSFKFTS
jgi:hypothetical protein